MAINKAIIQIRRGLKDDLQIDKLLPGELAIATDAPCMWFCWSVGNVEQVPTSDNLSEVVADVLKKYLEENPVVGISEIYMRVYDGYIQYSSDNQNWENVISIEELKGEKGDPGEKGDAGVGIIEITQETGSLDGGENKISIHLSDGSVKTISIYNGATGEPGPAGSDASVTAENIKSALGYTPANAEKLDRIFEDVLTEVETVLSSGTNKTLTLGIDYKAGDTLKFECLTDNTGVAEISYEIYMEPSEPDEDDDLIEEAGMGFVTIDPMTGSEKSYTKMTVNSTMLSFSVNGYVTAYRIDYKNASGSETGEDGTDNSAVKYEPQELTDDQKAQARTNIGAASEADKITISYDAENKIVRFLRAGGTLLELPAEKVVEYYKLLTDTDLTEAGVPADAAAVGERFGKLSQEIYQNGMAINELSEGVDELSEGVGELSEKVNNYTETLLCTGAKTTLTLGEDYNVGDTLKFECLSADADFVEIFCATSTEGNFESITIDPTSDETAYVTVIVEDDMLSFTVNKVVTVYRIYSKVLIDSELSEESTNPVQNKVVAKKITEITNEISQLGQEIVYYSNYVTPQMFGAKADGTTDDTEAIQSAINSGEEVFFPKGNYKITSPIVVPYGCTIKGTNDSIIIGDSSIDGFTISTDEVYIENITITDCKYAINLNGNKNVFSRVHLKNSTVGCYINSARAWGNNFNDCRFEYNDIGIESTIIYTSSFTDCKIAFNTNFGIKANLKFVKFEGGYIEANGADWDSVNKVYVERLGTAGIYLPNDSNNPSNSVYFIGVDFENNGETSIRHDNQGGASDFIFIGGQFVVSDHENVRSAIWINVYGHCIRWTFYGTKFPEGTKTIKRQIAGKEGADESDSTKKPTRFTTNRTWNSGNVNILQFATIDGNYQGYDTDYVTKAEKERWNEKPTTEQMNTAIENAIGEGVTMDAVNEAIDVAIFGAIEGEY